MLIKPCQDTTGWLVVHIIECTSVYVCFDRMVNPIALELVTESHHVTGNPTSSVKKP